MTSKINEIIQNVQILSMINEREEMSKRLAVCEEQMSEQLSVNEEISERLSFYERNESASMVGALDDTMEDIADQEAMATGDEDKKFNDEQHNLMNEELLAYIRITEEKTKHEMSLRKQVQALQKQHADTKTTYRKLAAVRHELHEAREMIKQLRAKTEADRFTKNRMVNNMKAVYEADLLEEKERSQKKNQEMLLELKKKENEILEMKVKIVQLNCEQKQTEKQRNVEQSRNEEMTKDFDQKMVDLKMVMTEKTIE